MTDESVTDAVKNAANAQADEAAAASEAASAEAAKHIAEGAIAATAAAEAAKALAETTAAEKINENKENVEWLKSHAQTTESSLAELHKRQTELSEALPGMFQSHREQTLSDLKQLLTPPKSNETPQDEEPDPTKVTPEQESADADAQREAEIKKKNKKGPKHRANWI